MLTDDQKITLKVTLSIMREELASAVTDKRQRECKEAIANIEFRLKHGYAKVPILTRKKIAKDPKIAASIKVPSERGKVIQEPDEKWVSLDYAADVLGISKQKVLMLCKSGLMVRIDNCVNRKSIEDYEATVALENKIKMQKKEHRRKFSAEFEVREAGRKNHHYIHLG